jgi:hypothetical protein
MKSSICNFNSIINIFVINSNVNILTSEINDLNSGLTIELWNREPAWDKLLGVYWLPFSQINKFDPSKVI